MGRTRVQFQSVISKPAETKSMNATAQRTEAAILLAASEVKGARVINFQNENIGDVDELLIEPDTGQVRFAVLSVGGFLGLGSTKVAVPWLAFQIVSERGQNKIYDAGRDQRTLGESAARRRQKLRAAIPRQCRRTYLCLLGRGVDGGAVRRRGCATSGKRLRSGEHGPGIES